jgi:hypothetical protein
MDENLHNIEDLFHSALENNEEESPSPDVWNAVEKRLDKDNIISIKRKYIYIKSIAVLLLLLLISFSLYEINNNSHNNNRLVKNNTIDSDSQKKLNKITDKPSHEKSENNSAIAIDTTYTVNNNKDKVAPNNSVVDNKGITNQQKEQPVNKDHLQKQNIIETTNSKKVFSKNQIVTNSLKRQQLTSKLHFKVKIKNAGPVKDEETIVQKKNEQADQQISSLNEPKNEPIANKKLQSKDSSDTKKISHPIVSSTAIVSDTTHKAVAKTITKKKDKISRFSLTPFVSPDIAWYYLQNDIVGNQPDNVSEIERQEKHEFSFTYGALVDYKINKHWGLQSGLTLSNTNIIVQPETIYAQKDIAGNIKYRINTSSGYGYVLPAFSANPAVGDSLYTFGSSHSLQYIGIPLVLTYNVTKGKFKFNVLAGLSANFLIKAKLKTTVEKGFDNEIETVDNLLGPKKVYFSGLAGVGVDYKLMRNTSINFAPVMRFALNPINKDATVKSYPNSFGFAVGLKIGL